MKPVRAIAYLLRGLARKRVLACLLIGVVVLTVRLALHPILGIPEPTIHDEFSYLLGGDTLARGRVANPTHPQWVFFETFHVLHQPAYVSKYPPAQAVFLAFGQRVLGHSWFGVWLSAGLMAAAVCWMLQGWLPPLWAFLTSLIAATQIGILEYWMNSYWGGAVAALGGALALGASLRLVRRERTSDALFGALGLVILANSRPFEGAVLSLACGIATLLWRRKRSRTLAALVRPRFWMPAALLLGFAAGAMGYYNQRITGSALTMPYELHQNRYTVVGAFVWQQPTQPPEYTHRVMRQFWTGWEVRLHALAREHYGGMLLVWARINQEFYFGGWMLTVVALFAAAGGFTWRVKFGGLVGVLFVAGVAGEKAILPHYAAPAAGLLYFALGSGLRYLGGLRWRGRRWGLGLAAAIVLWCAVQVALQAPARRSFSSRPEFARDRRSVLDTLQLDPSRHLVLVRYSERHSPHVEWVFNSADIDGSRVVWARDMGPERNKPLLEYFKNRKIWLLEPDQTPPKLTPYF